MHCFLVTGASGVVGGALVPVLLQQPATRVLVLLRPRGEQTVAARLEQLKNFWRNHYPGLPPSALDQRLTALTGDISAPGLGLSSEDTAEVIAHCTHLVHCAASVRLNQPLPAARAAAVAPTAAVIALARRCTRLCKVEFVSTVGVGGRWGAALPERWLHETRVFHNTYEQAKAEAEALIEAAIAQGLPASVHRPSMVVGDSRTGVTPHFQIFQFLCEFLSGRQTCGLTPQLGQAQLDIVPNDYVAAAIAAVALTPDSVGQIFHLCAGPQHALALKALQRTVRTRFRREGRLGAWPLLRLPSSWFLRLMRWLAPLLPPARRRALDTLPVYLDYLGSRQVFENGHSQARLQALGVQLPDTHTTLARALDYYFAVTRR